MTIELLYFDGCPSHEVLMLRLRMLMAQVGVDAPVELRRVESVEAAERERFLGSPTLRRSADTGNVDRFRSVRASMRRSRSRCWVTRSGRRRVRPRLGDLAARADGMAADSNTPPRQIFPFTSPLS